MLNDDHRASEKRNWMLLTQPEYLKLYWHRIHPSNYRTFKWRIYRFRNQLSFNSPQVMAPRRQTEWESGKYEVSLHTYNYLIT
uniref:Uncharacterized protein n=1 Tax=Strigamia maritima TaxID=126957 RepID=T1JMU3_STRMM